MTDRELARILVQRDLLTMRQVQQVAKELGNGKNFAQLVTEKGFVSIKDVLSINPDALGSRNGAIGQGSHSAASHNNGFANGYDIENHAANGSNGIVPLTVHTNGSIANGTNGSNGSLHGDANGSGHVYTLPLTQDPLDPFASMGLGQEPASELDDEQDDKVILADEDPRFAGNQASGTVKLCNDLLRDAVVMRASDVHLEPCRNGLLPRFRVDGLLRSCSKELLQQFRDEKLLAEKLRPEDKDLLRRDLQPAIVSRFKVMANLNITECRLSQDGRFRATVCKRPFDFRVSTLPGIYGEKVVLRLLDHSSLVTDLRTLGFSDGVRQSFEEMLRRSHGMILVTGPTGSGKTTTLYAALASSRDETKNIVTVEDPVEYELEGVMQTHVHAEIGNTFAARLRSILRQDPDVILVGEIRDTETADIAVRAALTGHLLLSTLHTNSAASAVTRLQDMGVPPFLMASSLSGIIAQRLVRTICRNCKQPVPQDTPEYEMSITELRLPPGTTIYHGTGCSECNDTGFRGRVAVVELLNVDKTIRRAIMDREDADTLHQKAIDNGMKTLWQDGIEKLKSGLTTADELTRVLLGAEDLVHHDLEAVTSEMVQP